MACQPREQTLFPDEMKLSAWRSCGPGRNRTQGNPRFAKVGIPPFRPFIGASHETDRGVWDRKATFPRSAGHRARYRRSWTERGGRLLSCARLAGCDCRYYRLKATSGKGGRPGESRLNCALEMGWPNCCTSASWSFAPCDAAATEEHPGFAAIAVELGRMGFENRVLN
jgi:hypothetical protein